MSAYIFIINVRSSVAENITKQNPEKRGTIHIYSLADFRETKNTISIGGRLKLEPSGCFIVLEITILFLRASNKVSLPGDHSTASASEIQGHCYYILAGLEVSQPSPGSTYGEYIILKMQKYCLIVRLKS